jgi:hypothetical protein
MAELPGGVLSGSVLLKLYEQLAVKSFFTFANFDINN